MRSAEGPAGSNPLVAAVLAGSAPRHLKISAARGVLPLLKAELLRILVVLLADGDGEVRREAGAKLASFPEDELLPLLEDPTAPPGVLDHFGGEAPGRGALKAAVLANPATPPDTLRRMAPCLPTDLIERLLLNLTRLIATPDLLDLLGSNPSLSPAQRARIDEIRRHFLRVPAPGEPRSDEGAAGAPPEATPDVAAPAAVAEEEAGGSQADAETAAVLDNVTQKILRLNTAQKIQLAFRGTREERSILIKDSSKSVQEAVLESPKLAENEVESIAKMRSVAEDVLRIIAGNRDWMKNYSIVHSLTTNPKTPVGIAMNLVARLTSRDLKILVGDRNVPEVIRRQARKVSDSRNQGPGQGHH